jgi:hypothetical protein
MSALLYGFDYIMSAIVSYTAYSVLVHGSIVDRSSLPRIDDLADLLFDNIGLSLVSELARIVPVLQRKD